MADVRFVGITVRKGAATLLEDVSLSLGHGEMTAVLGASGSGKTTLLRVAAGLDSVDEGDVLFDGESMRDVQPADRDLAMVFQDNTLIPFMTARANVRFPLDVRSFDESEIDKRVGSEARALRIEALLDRHPRELSAGERQMVQIARAMVRRPRLLLMDEPLARLDAPVRRKMRSELRRIQSGYGVTTLYATNDPEEAMAIADRGVVLDRGRVVQVGSMADLYARPVHRVVAELFSSVPGAIVTMRVVAEGSSPPLLESGGLRLDPRLEGLRSLVGSDVVVMIRAEDVQQDPVGPFAARILGSTIAGSSQVTSLDVAGTALWMLGDRPPGERVDVRIRRFHVFAIDGGLLGTCGR